MKRKPYHIFLAAPYAAALSRKSNAGGFSHSALIEQAVGEFLLRNGDIKQMASTEYVEATREAQEVTS